jgi:hypothetical protein
MIVADLDCVRVFSGDGLYVKELKPPHVQGEHWKVGEIHTGPRGELVAFDEDTERICVLDADGALLWTSKLDDDLKPDLMAMDWRGQLLCVPEGIADVYVCKPEPSEES